MSRPRLLDLFCGAGGAGMGYHRAGFDVVGVDIELQPDYPFSPRWFIQGDALEVLYNLLAGGRYLFGHDGALRLSDFAAIHASPPCQARTTMSNRWRGGGGVADSHENLIDPTRDLLLAAALPYVIENVPGARRDLVVPFTLTGEMFDGLQVHRPRLFETNWPILVPQKPPIARNTIGVYGKAPDGRLLWRRTDGSEQHAASSVAEAQTAMGMPWADWRGLAEAIPPAYTEMIGAQLLVHLALRATA